MNIKKEMVIVKAENKELQGRLKITLSELEIKRTSQNKTNTGSKTLQTSCAIRSLLLTEMVSVMIMVHPLWVLKVKQFLFQVLHILLHILHMLIM